MDDRDRELDRCPISHAVGSDNWITNSTPPSSYDLTILSMLNGTFEPESYDLMNGSFDPDSYDLTTLTSCNNEVPPDRLTME